MGARELINEADKIRRSKEITQAEWSRLAGLDEDGSIICRTYNRGNCKLSTMVNLLRPLGYELKIIKVEDLP